MLFRSGRLRGWTMPNSPKPCVKEDMLLPPGESNALRREIPSPTPRTCLPSPVFFISELPICLVYKWTTGAALCGGPGARARRPATKCRPPIHRKDSPGRHPTGGGPQSPSPGRFKGVSRGEKSKSPLWYFLGFGASLTPKRPQDAVKTHSLPA